jgi:SAM-dependent methyltransferase
MDDREASLLWEENAEVWTLLARSGWDIFRDHFNTPAFFDLLPNVDGRTGLDIGCGEGHNTRLLTQRGARVYAIDIAPTFVKHAKQAAGSVEYAIASGQMLPFPAAAFDFVTAFMSLMDLPQPQIALGEAERVLKPGGFLQFSITHPCFDTPHRRRIRDAQGKTIAMEVGGYYQAPDGQIDEWIFHSAPREVTAGLRKFRIPRFQRTIADWLNMSVEAGLVIERVSEPRATDEAAARFPTLQGTQVVPFFLHIRCRKPWVKRVPKST